MHVLAMLLATFAFAKGEEQNIFCFTPDGVILVAADLATEEGQTSLVDLGFKIRGEFVAAETPAYTPITLAGTVLGRRFNWLGGELSIYDMGEKVYENRQGDINGVITLEVNGEQFRELGLVCSSPAQGK